MWFSHPQMDGALEGWVHQLVAALGTRPVNVGLADWLALAHQHYSVAVRNIRLVGQEVAMMLRWLEVRPLPTCAAEVPQGGSKGRGTQAGVTQAELRDPTTTWRSQSSHRRPVPPAGHQCPRHAGS